MFVAWLGWLFLNLVLNGSTKAIIISLIIAVVVGIIVGDVKGAIGVLLFPIILGLLGFLAKCLIAGWFLFAIFGYAMYIAMDFTAVYMIVYAIRHRKKAK